MEPLRVLIVDDEEELVTTLVERLNLRNIRTRGVTSGAEALRLISEESFDVILLDVKMPGMDGLKVTRQIKEKHPAVGVVLLSGHGDAKDLETGIQCGACDYLLKPFDIEALVRVLFRAAGKEASSK